MLKSSRERKIRVWLGWLPDASRVPNSKSWSRKFWGGKHGDHLLWIQGSCLSPSRGSAEKATSAATKLMAVRNTSMFTSAPTTNPSSCTGVSLHQDRRKGHHWCLEQGHRDGGLSFQPKEVPTTRQTLYQEMAKDQLSIYIRLSCLQDPRRGGDINRPVLAATGEMNLGQDIMHWDLMDGSVCRTAEYILHHEMAKIYIPAHSAEAPAALLSTRTPTPVSDFLPPHRLSEFSDFYQLPFWKSEDGTPTPGVSNQAFAKNEKSRLWNTASAQRFHFVWLGISILAGSDDGEANLHQNSMHSQSATPIYRLQNPFEVLDHE